MAIENCKGNANGLGLVDQGKEHTIEELGDYDESSVKKYSMAWLNPVTDEKAFMVHGIAARKLYIRSGPDEQPRVIEDLTEIRKFLADIQLRILKPEYICMAPVEVLLCGTTTGYSTRRSTTHWKRTARGACIKQTSVRAGALWDLFQYQYRIWSDASNETAEDVTTPITFP
ncbi:hypothetical protein LTR97_004464 [Elasticomyces elasticus]|uniref:Uncharacterized protein n=1 Tax=Elasticomyces elasticus TaxID=574655 RepID=A0AAN7W6N6_9PEZI|nr:hypothetical protein LTR97_004464 [Elasticomyces elasticus]